MKEKDRCAPRAVSCDCHPDHTTSSVFLRGEHLFAGAACSPPADGRLVHDSHLEKAKKKL